jgi:hypothetical protein
MKHFVYMWHDAARKMFYVGKHSGEFDDLYTASSRWLAGEIRYRPKDFKRRIIRTFDTKNEAQKYEGYLLTLIQEHEWGTKYYNMKQGKPKGIAPWNAGKTGIYSAETINKMSKAKQGKASWNTGIPNPNGRANALKGSAKLSHHAQGRRRLYRDDGSWTWTK